METREFGENLIIELMSKESEYGDDDSALLRLCRRLLGRGLANRDPGTARSRNIKSHIGSTRSVREIARK